MKKFTIIILTLTFLAANFSVAYTTLFNDSCDYANGQQIDWPNKWTSAGWAPTREYNGDKMRIQPGDWDWSDFICNPKCRADNYVLVDPNTITGIWFSVDVSDITVNTTIAGTDCQIMLGLFSPIVTSGPYNADQTGVYLIVSYDSGTGNLGFEAWKKPPSAEMGTQIAVGNSATFSAGAKLEFYVNDTIVSARYNNAELLCSDHNINFATLNMDNGLTPMFRFSNNNTARCQADFDNFRIEQRDAAASTTDLSDSFPANPATTKWTISDSSVTNDGAGNIVLSPGTGQAYYKDFIAPMSEYYQAGRFAALPSRSMEITINDATVYSSAANPDGYTQIQATPELVLDNMWNFRGTILATRLAYNDLNTVDFSLMKIVGGSETRLATSNTPYVAGAKLKLTFNNNYVSASYGTGTVILTATHGLTIPSAFPDGVYFNAVQANANATASVGIGVSAAGVNQGTIIPEPVSIILSIAAIAFFIRRK